MFNEYRTLLVIVVAVMLLVGASVYREHLINTGVEQCHADIDKAVIKDRAEQDAKRVVQEDTVNAIGDQFHETTTAPLDIPVPIVRVCNHAIRTILVPEASPAAVLDNAAAKDGAADSGDSQGRDIGTPLVTVGRDADGQITALQRYINEVCLK